MEQPVNCSNNFRLSGNRTLRFCTWVLHMTQSRLLFLSVLRLVRAAISTSKAALSEGVLVSQTTLPVTHPTHFSSLIFHLFPVLIFAADASLSDLTLHPDIHLQNFTSAIEAREPGAHPQLCHHFCH